MEGVVTGRSRFQIARYYQITHAKGVVAGVANRV
jgi:hypothetical protein